MPGRPRFDPETERYIVARHALGSTQQELADTFGLAQSNISRLIRRRKRQDAEARSGVAAKPKPRRK